MNTTTLGNWGEMTESDLLVYCQWARLDVNHFREEWRRCGLSADYFASYTALIVPSPPPEGRVSRDDLQYVVSYLLNELFENCAKFSSGPISQVTYACGITPDSLIFAITNHISPDRQAQFEAVISELLTADVDELYFQRLEAGAANDTPESGLGYLTLIKDYGIRFGFRFVPVSAYSVAVTVQAHVSLQGA